MKDAHGNNIKHDEYYKVTKWFFGKSGGWRVYRVWKCLRAHVFAEELRFYRPLRWGEGLGEVREKEAECGLITVQRLSEQEVEAYICEDENDW